MIFNQTRRSKPASTLIRTSAQQLFGAQNQCPVDFENALSTITPLTIRPIPRIAAASSFCPNNTTPINAINTMPSPDQIAYATPTGIERNVNASSQKAQAYPTITTSDGHKRVKPSLALSAEVAMTSATMATPR